MLDKLSLRVLNTSMNIIRDILLTINGGSMNTALLNFLVFFVYSVLFVALGIASTYLMALIKTDSQPTGPIIITDAQE